jgi:hypothetical protein
MAHLVRRANVEQEKAILIAFLRAYLSNDAGEARFEWLYRRNPAGIALVWVAYDSDSNGITGLSAAFPRQVLHRGGTTLGYVLGDFCISPDHRSLGPGLALQRATLDALSQEGAGFVWDFPSASMLAIYKRLRIEATATMIRYAKPMRADRQMQRRIPSKLAAGGLAAVANMALRVRDTALSSSGVWTIAEQTKPCGEEFTQAARRWAAAMDICPARDADYMNWRFLGHPQRCHHLLTARNGESLGGFLVYYLSGDDAVIVDLFAPSDSAARALLVEAIQIARDQHAQTLSAAFLSWERGQNVLEECGFQPRESFPLILLRRPGNGGPLQSGDPERWYLAHGDRES